MRGWPSQILLLSSMLLLACPAGAQQADPAGAGAQQADPAATHSGYTADEVLEGGDSVTGDLADDDVAVGSVLEFPRFEGLFDPWFDTKRRLNERYGLKLQVSYQMLYQWADETLGEDEGAAGRAEVQGTWGLLGRDGANPGALSFRFEHRHTLGTDIPPSQLGRGFGSATSTGTGFSDFGGNVSEIAWRQTLLDGQLKLVAGKISATSWYNAFALSSPKRGFQNTALQSSASKAAPGRGIGGGGAIRLGDRFVALAGIHDANARTPDDPFDTIDEGELFYSAELRWFPTSYDRRKWDQVRVQVWYQDARRKAGFASGHGVTFAASRLFHDFWMPFLLGGVSDGDATVFEADVVGGVGFAFNTKHRAARDVLAFAVGWGKPSDGRLQDQITTELFYRFQLVERLAITPSVQCIVNPASNPDRTQVWVLGIRSRWTF